MPLRALAMVLVLAPAAAPATAQAVSRCHGHSQCARGRTAKYPRKPRRPAPTGRRAPGAPSNDPTVVGAQRSDAGAGALVHRSSFEPRPDNAAANAHMPSAGDLRYFREHSDMPYKNLVTGRFTGTTDEIIQWAAYKHGLSPDLLRAVADVESTWHMSTVGDNGDSFGLFQIRRPYHCCDFLARGSTAFNADYYGAIVRSYYDGLQSWLNTVSGSARPYAAGDLWGSVGAWGSGRWHDPHAQRYIARVRQFLAQREWLRPGW